MNAIAISFGLVRFLLLRCKTLQRMRWERERKKDVSFFTRFEWFMKCTQTIWVVQRTLIAINCKINKYFFSSLFSFRYFFFSFDFSASACLWLVHTITELYWATELFFIWFCCCCWVGCCAWNMMLRSWFDRFFRCFACRRALDIIFTVWFNSFCMRIRCSHNRHMDVASLCLDRRSMPSAAWNRRCFV